MGIYKRKPLDCEISPSNGKDLDERVALRHFSGLDYKQAEMLLRDNFCYYIEYFKYMGDYAELYYLESVKNYLEGYELPEDAQSLYESTYYLIELFENISQRESIGKDRIKNTAACTIRNFLIEKLQEIYDNYEMLTCEFILPPKPQKILKMIQKLKSIF